MKMAFLVMVCIITTSLQAGADDTARFASMVRRCAGIRNIEADIVQHLKQGSSPPVTFRGSYCADQKGRFRIDYHAPEHQIVVFNGKRLLWYFPGQRLLYEYGNSTAGASAPGILPLREFSLLSDRGSRVTYCGRHLAGIFTVVDIYKLGDKRRNVTVEIWIDPELKAVIRKIVRSGDDVEVMRESYSIFSIIKGVPVPARISVKMRTNSGIQSSVTRYSNIRINRKTGEGVFRLDVPPDVQRRSGQ